MSRLRDRLEYATRWVIWRAIWYALVAGRLYAGPRVVRWVAWWGLAHVGSWSYSPRAAELCDRIKARA